ncbi:hypothetical protein DEU56DRAFT_794413 [Suillus clintonianus]|uniref:uncharacterized protein n=1 Tax=Suillus clintonianus TaxID=1904413 RepID=UPI001B85CBFC|nr:uncharacterized protein DEU56DRAFT_794413 [Suillus clintonianus]KAG2142438.1 hypothetical protein DEU56DRAFT_794413 [Suillus clintonianus]
MSLFLVATVYMHTTGRSDTVPLPHLPQKHHQSATFRQGLQGTMGPGTTASSECASYPLSGSLCSLIIGMPCERRGIVGLLSRAHNPIR